MLDSGNKKWIAHSKDTNKKVISSNLNENLYIQLKPPAGEGCKYIVHFHHHQS